ncbi:multiple epidermal growth factor-like domains protein 10 [Saccostrea cucullata]|uniref:multiple epidermal growth factor-like domains protein 10 n=1 Tax=Saccostrea cuccullata TaxID=36930 RepID=UPI002ED03A85
MEIVFSIYFLLHFSTKVSSFEQLIKPGMTVATSSSVGWGGFANKTVDGNYSQNNYTYCMHTEKGHREAWLKIDLGDVYNLKSVKIWYRADNKIESVNTKRLKGFSIRLSKLPELNSSEICYQDPGNESLPIMLSRFCKGVARYVWFYTDKDNGGGVFLEICEVDVYGCPEKHSGENCSKCNYSCYDTCDIINGECSCTKPGYEPPECVKQCPKWWYGPNCKNRCENCKKGVCDHVTGDCEKGCKNGWKNDIKCDQPCNKGYYGKNCSKSCGRCANKKACNFKNGNCPSGKCEPGWTSTLGKNGRKGKKCDQECPNGTFGLNCKHNCSGHCTGGLSCNKTTGICDAGCTNGWRTPRCSKKCNEGFYGKNCINPCGHCANKSACDHVTGFCPLGNCAPGFKSFSYKSCDKECDDKTFGKNCEETCSGHCRGGLPCNKTDGRCPGGCADGWMNPYCNETCSHGLYGRECRFPCGKCARNAHCNHVNGSCPFGDCMPGFKQKDDQRCDKECDKGSFGDFCEKNCSGHCAEGLHCNKTDGVCPRGCEDGWILPNCNETCKKGFYGTVCSLSCGFCALNATCDHVTGSCPSGLCQPGWKKTQDKRCDKECEYGSFGKHCMYSCSRQCKEKLHCNKINGACFGGCKDGWTNDQCNKPCSIGWYGKDCQEKCGHCGGTETCRHINGSCPGQCGPGYQGEKCDIECEDGAFGFSCNNSCAKGCLSVCNKKIGTCDQCLSGYIGDFCNITVAESQAQDSTMPAAGVGIPITIIVVIALTALVTVLMRKARQKKAADLDLPERNKII